jgi:hypothetical protein
MAATVKAAAIPVVPAMVVVVAAVPSPAAANVDTAAINSRIP